MDREDGCGLGTSSAIIVTILARRAALARTRFNIGGISFRRARVSGAVSDETQLGAK